MLKAKEKRQWHLSLAQLSEFLKEMAFWEGEGRNSKEESVELAEKGCCLLALDWPKIQKVL